MYFYFLFFFTTTAITTPITQTVAQDAQTIAIVLPFDQPLSVTDELPPTEELPLLELPLSDELPLLELPLSDELPLLEELPPSEPG